VLAVVQHKQHLAARQMGNDHLKQRSIRPLARAEHRGDRLRDQQWVRTLGMAARRVGDSVELCTRDATHVK
jgi:hypothetical protein